MAITYVDALTVAINVVDNEEVVDKLEALREQIAKKKGSSKPTKTQVENEKIKEAILNVLADADEPITVKEILKLLEDEYSSQKISALLRQLINAEKVEKVIEKKVSRFALV